MYLVLLVFAWTAAISGTVTIDAQNPGGTVSTVAQNASGTITANAQKPAISTYDKNQVRQGIIEGQGFVNELKKANNLINVLKKMPGFISFWVDAIDTFGKLIGLFGHGESGIRDELQKGFSEINSRLDDIQEELKLIERTIHNTPIWERYRKIEDNIRTMDRKMQGVFVAPNPKHAIEIFIRVYEDLYDEAGGKLYDAIVSDSRIMLNNLLEFGMEVTQHDRRKMETFMRGQIALLIKASDIEISYERFKNYSLGTAKIWKQRLVKAMEAMRKTDSDLVYSWKSRYAKEADDLAKKYNGRIHQDFANNVRKFFQTKYYWRNWYVLSYNAVRGWSVHTVGGADVHYKFRFYGRNFMVGSTDKSAYFSKWAASYAIRNVKCRDWTVNCIRYGTKKVSSAIRTVGSAKAILYAGNRFRGVNWAVAADNDRWMSKRMLLYKRWLPVRRYYTVIMFG